MAADHQAELDGLKESDPDFYQRAAASSPEETRRPVSGGLGRDHHAELGIGGCSIWFLPPHNTRHTHTPTHDTHTHAHHTGT